MQYYQNQFHPFVFTFSLQLSEHSQHRLCILLLLASAAVGAFPSCILSYTRVSLREGTVLCARPSPSPSSFLPLSLCELISELEGGEAWWFHLDLSFLEGVPRMGVGGEIVGRASVLQRDISEGSLLAAPLILAMAGDTTQVYLVSDSGPSGTPSFGHLQAQACVKN